MSAEYDAAIEIKAGLHSIVESVDCLPSMHDYFAGQAMQALIARHGIASVHGTGSYMPAEIAEKAYAMAAAMLDNRYRKDKTNLSNW